MSTQYATFNHKLGTYDYHSSVEGALECYINMLIDFIKDPYFNTIYSTVIKNDDGSETWKNENGDITKIITHKDFSRSLQGRLDASLLTKVEVL